jgi:P-type Ca2+ transporter type 2C
MGSSVQVGPPVRDLGRGPNVPGDQVAGSGTIDVMAAPSHVAIRAAGLTSAEAAAQLARWGPNRVAARQSIPWWRRVVEQLRDPLIVVLLVAVVLTLLTGDYPDSIIVAVVVGANTAVGVVQEVRADNAVAALTALTAPAARVLRDGVSKSIPADEVVPGDVVELAEGDIVPADADLIEAVALLVDESALTGESVPVDKGPSAHEASGQVQAGTVVVRGRAVTRVSATGAASSMGRIAALLDTGPSMTPLQHRLVGLGRVLAGVAAVLCLVVGILGLLRGQPLELMVVTAISLVVAAVPESLPAVVTLSLAMGARRMAARHAIVRRLAAVETLGSVTTIATDKTGTLTEGRMVVEWLWTPGGEAAVTGTGYAPHGEVLTDRGPIDTTRPDATQIVELLSMACLCSAAALQPPDSRSPDWAAVGDPTEAALLAAAGKLGVTRADLESRFPRIAEVPFDSVRKRMTTVHQGRGRVLVACKGAPEIVLREPLLAEDRILLAAAAARAAAFAADGYRVLAVARGWHEHRPGQPPIEPSTAEHGLRLLGLIAVADPPRQAAATTVAACLEAGITPVLITGDHLATARSVAIRVGIIGAGDEVATGDQLRGATPPDPTQVRVFARTTPEQKLDIVQAWRQSGQVVAMTGDGVNDGPALHRADIGVAMGRRGTEVARQAADLILADDDLATVVAAVEEGRRVYANVRRFLLYGLSGGVAEILIMLIGPALGMALPLLPAQILWVNLMTHGLPGVALGAEPADPAAMHHPPRPPAESVLGDGLWLRIARLGVVIMSLSLAVAGWAHATGRPWQSMLFLTLATAQLGVAIGVRARPGTWQNPFLLLAVAGAFGLQVLAVYLPPLQELLGTTSLALPEIGAITAVSTLSYLAARLERRLPHTAPATPR